jgi:hypothetical protein
MNAAGYPAALIGSREEGTVSEMGGIDSGVKAPSKDHVEELGSLGEKRSTPATV